MGVIGGVVLLLYLIILFLDSQRNGIRITMSTCSIKQGMSKFISAFKKIELLEVIIVLFLFLPPVLCLSNLIYISQFLLVGILIPVVFWVLKVWDKKGTARFESGILKIIFSTYISPLIMLLLYSYTDQKQLNAIYIINLFIITIAAMFFVSDGIGDMVDAFCEAGYKTSGVRYHIFIKLIRRSILGFIATFYVPAFWFYHMIYIDKHSGIFNINYKSNLEMGSLSFLFIWALGWLFITQSSLKTIRDIITNAKTYLSDDYYLTWSIYIRISPLRKLSITNIPLYLSIILLVIPEIKSIYDFYGTIGISVFYPLLFEIAGTLISWGLARTIQKLLFHYKFL